MTGLELIFTELHLLALERVAAVRPAEEAQVVEAVVAELCTIDWRLRPNLAIGEECPLVALCLVELLLPLEHLDLSLQTVAVFGHDAELLIAQIFLIVRLACDMDQTVVVILVGLVVVNADASFAGAVNQLSEGYSLLLILPEQDLGEWNQENAEHHQQYAMWILSLVRRVITCI